MRRFFLFLRDVGAVLGGWGLLLAAEHLAVGIGYRRLFVAGWEMGLARTLVTPIALAALLPLAVVLALAKPLFSRVDDDGLARLLAASTLAWLAGWAALDCSHGRHFADPKLRVGFIAGAALVALAAGYALAGPIARARAASRALVGLGFAAASWCIDAFVLPRLYPGFHALAFVLVLLAGALVGTWVAGSRLVSAIFLVAALVSCAWAPRAVKKLATVDNLRIVLLEHAPIMGRAVKLAAAVAPPPPLDDDGSDAAPSRPTARQLDWTGDDIVLLTVDALRADHLGIYGSARATSPHIDELAAHGVVFDAAYCPTPHTSYSITSLMTGKYMRPLLALGLGEDSETWASIMRKYSYKTAAFYPPAVFFIDEDKFSTFEGSKLDFEYAKVEFADASLRAEQVDSYLQQADPTTPLFLWVHFFEPHEPYVMHPSHRFGGDHPTDVDAYDSEIAEADEGIGRVVAAVRAQRPHAVIIVTADHGEEFGDHGGRYHGTTTYEEQVRVPLVVVAPNIVPHRVETPVQTIDLLPTVLSALGIPAAPRIRGRDDSRAIAKEAAPDDGFAFVETDAMTTVAKKNERLVCQRAVDACALYDVANDPHESRDLAPNEPERVKALRALGVATVRDTGRFEGKGADLPDALRRGAQGDASASSDVASLLDDARADIRLKAAEITFDLHVPTDAPSARRALGDKSADPDVAAWCALALVRMGEAPTPAAERLVTDPRPTFRRAAALAFAEQGDARGAAALADDWRDEGRKMPLLRALDVLKALGRIKDVAAVPALIATLDDVRLRPYVADTLGAIGDPRAKEPLLEHLAVERYVTTRPHEAKALAALGVGGELLAPLAKQAGAPEPMLESVAILRSADALTAAHGGWSSAAPQKNLTTKVTVPAHVPLRLLVMTAVSGDAITGTAEKKAIGAPLLAEGAVAAFDLEPASGASLTLTLAAPSGLEGLWIVPRD